MPDYGLKIKRAGINKDVEDCDPEELAFWSAASCAKIIQPGRYNYTLSAFSSAEYTIAFDATVAIPILVLAFSYDPSDSSYVPCTYSFNTSNLYLTASNSTGAEVSSHFIYFICYA